MEVEITLNGKKRYVRDNMTVFQAATAAGVYIPHFCYHPKLTIAANCRMCLVEVNKMPKPVPACATYVTDGMEINTDSVKASATQKGVMELLLVNHPLDCPICDQGGECQLQDLAVGYGASCTRYGETKRVVVEKQLGPLITTAMTRCIHCTRCVRFGEEVAGKMELGLAGRGEHAEIMAFVGKTVDSELSGNMIDICPVGALNSKPFQFSARTWELERQDSVSVHDSWGSFLTVQSKDERVKRVLPRNHEEINQCWISDRDRFAYTGLYSPQRLIYPMIVDDGAKVSRRVDWSDALATAGQRLQKAVDRHGAKQVGFLIGPAASAEEALLAAELARGLGCPNIDWRLRQIDFSGDSQEMGLPWLGCTIHDLESLPGVLLAGCNPASELPLLPLRLKGVGALASIGSVRLAGLLADVQQLLVSPGKLAHSLAAVTAAAAAANNMTERLPDWIGFRPEDVGDEHRQIARLLPAGSAVLIGAQAQLGADYHHIHHLAQVLAGICSGFSGVLPTAGNALGMSLAGALPHRAAMGEEIEFPGLPAGRMVAERLKAYVLIGCEPLDFADPKQAKDAFSRADTVISLDCFEGVAKAYADIQLPIATAYERAGSTVNLEGNEQFTEAMAPPPGEAREAWKVLRMLGASLLGEQSFAYQSIAQVRTRLGREGDFSAHLRNALSGRPDVVAPVADTTADEQQLARVPEVSHFATEPLLRRAQPLQDTTIASRSACALVNPADLNRLGLADGDRVCLEGDGGDSVVCTVRSDAGVAPGCIRAAGGEAAFAQLGSAQRLRISADQQRQAA
ncbi:MAG: NADH-quinone oxidoreductase subunit NuoG [Betaproteobacteria bacterium]|nr:NADH-quinone oxidoreductase subunit NuoG [Betaproteobacteria bacterium]